MGAHPDLDESRRQIASADAVSMGWYLLPCGVFTLLVFVVTRKVSKGLQVVFFSLAILFFLLAAGGFDREHDPHTHWWLCRYILQRFRDLL